MDIRVGDRLKLKKPHPCGSYLWLTLRIGMDFRVRCEGCGHEVMLPREKIEKRIRRVIRDGVEINPNAAGNPLKPSEAETKRPGRE